jgi:hypothetical protein
MRFAVSATTATRTSSAVVRTSTAMRWASAGLGGGPAGSPDAERRRTS